MYKYTSLSIFYLSLYPIPVLAHVLMCFNSLFFFSDTVKHPPPGIFSPQPSFGSAHYGESVMNALISISVSLSHFELRRHTKQSHPGVFAWWMRKQSTGIRADFEFTYKSFLSLFPLLFSFSLSPSVSVCVIAVY